MTKQQMTQHLMQRYDVSFEVASDALRANDWDLMMAGGEIRDNQAAEEASKTQWDDWANQHDSRKTEAQMIEDDHGYALEMDREMQIDADRKAGRPVDEDGNDTREWCGRDIEAAHSEALEMDRQMHQDEFFNASTMMQGVWINLNHAEALEIEHRRRVGKFFFGMDDAARRKALDGVHAEALKLNSRFNLLNGRFSHWWDVYSYAVRQDLLEKAHAEALEMDAALEAQPEQKGMIPDGLVVEVDGTSRTARVVAKFETTLLAKCAERAFNEMVNSNWYGGRKDVVYSWVPAKGLTNWSIAYGYRIVE